MDKDPPHLPSTPGGFPGPRPGCRGAGSSGSPETPSLPTAPRPPPALKTGRPEPLRPPRPQTETGSAERTAFSAVSGVTRPQGGTERCFVQDRNAFHHLRVGLQAQMGTGDGAKPKGTRGGFEMRGTLLRALP